MSQSDCARLVEQGDPHRFRAALAARAGLRGDLLTLYAFNLQIARVPWLTQEPLIAEMRLQWWRDVITEPAPRAHEVAGPLHQLIVAHALPLDVLDRLIAARLWEVWDRRFADAAALRDYLDATSGGLMWLAGRIAGAGQGDEPVFRAFGQAMGMANFLVAVPDLVARGVAPLPDGADPASLAAEALAQLRAQRRAARALAPAPREALLAAYAAEPILSLARAQPWRIAAGALALPEVRHRWRLMWQALSARP